MSTIYDLIQHELMSLAQAIEDLRAEVSQLRAEKNRTVMVGNCVRVEGNRCELEFASDDDEFVQRSGLVPWLERTGTDYQSYQSPSVGEQGLLLNYGEGDALNAGIALFGIRSDKNPLPSTNTNQMVFNFEGGIKLKVDRESGQTEIDVLTNALNVKVKDQASFDVQEFTVSGKLIAGNIESKSEVKDKSRTMTQIATIFNNHTNPGNGASPPPTQIP